MDESLSKEGDRFVYRYFNHCGIPFCFSWPVKMEFVGPGSIINPLIGYDDEHDLLIWRFGADYAKASYRVIFGNYDSGEFVITAPNQAKHAAVIISWPQYEEWPVGAGLSSEHCARYGQYEFYFRYVERDKPVCGHDYWIVSKDHLGEPYLEYANYCRQQLEEQAATAWSQYDQRKNFYYQHMREINSQKPWLEKILHAQLHWGDDALTASFGPHIQPMTFLYDHDGIDALNEVLQDVQTMVDNRRPHFG